MYKIFKHGKKKCQTVFYFVCTFIHSIYHAVHRAIYQLFVPFVIHEEKFGTIIIT